MVKILFLLLFLLPGIVIAQLTDFNKEELRIELAQRINTLRIEQGLKQLLQSKSLKDAAEFHSGYMEKEGVLSHDEKNSKYATPNKRVVAMEGNDFEIVGENILYSTPQKFPLRTKGIKTVANEMFNSWKNSPGHYANMINPNYVFGDLGFKETKTGVIYATQVFGTKGHVVKSQLSKNYFELKIPLKECDKETIRLSNIVMNMGNNLEIKGKEVIFSYHDIQYFQKIFTDPKDGIAIDLVSKEQLACGKPNQLDFSPIYDGILLKPIFKNDLLAGNTAESNYRLITKVADIPENIDGSKYSASFILIKNGKVCQYVYPAQVPRDNYDLRSIEPIVEDELNTELVKDGIIASQTINYEFNTDETRAVNLPSISELNFDIHSIRIQSYSSVEGDSEHNAELHNSRAATIKKHLKEKLGARADTFKIDARENWNEMRFQLNYFGADTLAILSNDSLKSILQQRVNSLPWDSLLFVQRKSIATINYFGKYNEAESEQSHATFNLRTAVAMNNPKLANKAMFEMFHSAYYSPYILFEPQLVEFINKYPETVGNFTALLSHDYMHDAYSSASFIFGYLNRTDELSSAARTNLIYLYTLLGSHLLDNWDVSAERLSNVIHPTKIDKFTPKKVAPELVLNLHLTFIQYFGQVNDGTNISKSFNFIADYFRTNDLSQEEDVDLTLFFNNWSMYKMTIDHLIGKFRDDELNEDGLFVLAATMNFINYLDVDGIYVEVQNKAYAINPERWCQWLSEDFQVKRNSAVKQIYCTYCE